MDPKARLWTTPPPPYQPPAPPVPLWTLRRGSDLMEAALRFDGEFGVEAQFYRRGTFRYGHRFHTKAEAVAWAELEREALAREGWELIPS